MAAETLSRSDFSRAFVIARREIRDGFRLYEKCDGDFYDWKNGNRGTFKHKKLPDGNWEVIKTNDAKLIINKKKLGKFRRAMELFARYYDHLWD